MSTEVIHTSRTRLGPFPPAAPSDPNAPHVSRASIAVDASIDQGPVARVWESIGYDEINWTYTPTGRRLLQTFSGISGNSYFVRPHYVFCSGSGFGIPHWGSGNVYHETEQGEPYYDFTIVDLAYDAIVDAGHRVLVELGFTPRDLLPPEAEELKVVPSPTAYTSYEAGAWGYPPRDYDKWAGLVEALARHCLERYSEEAASAWLWELWNEPDIFYWRGTPQQFNELYTVTARAVRNVLPNAKVGGPTVTSGGLEFLRQFLDYTAERGEPLDFISYHTKGSRFPTREYGPIGAPPRQQLSPSTTKMLYDLRSFNRAIAEYEQYRGLPAIVDECDAAVPAHYGRYDTLNYDFQNTEYYPVFQLKLMKKILDLNATETVQVEQATSWSFYFEGERYFEGTRSFLTAGGVEKPFLNAYRMLARLGHRRVLATSDAAWEIGELDETDGSQHAGGGRRARHTRRRRHGRRAGLAAHGRPVSERRRRVRGGDHAERAARRGVSADALPDRRRPQQLPRRLDVAGSAAGPDRRGAGNDQEPPGPGGGRTGQDRPECTRTRTAQGRRPAVAARRLLVDLQPERWTAVMTHSGAQVTLNNGVEIPQVGFGVFQVPPEAAQHVVEEALAAGYRHIDTAAAYNNEAGVGAAIKASGLDRHEVFVTTKLRNGDQGFDQALQAYSASCRRLGMDYVDLYLIHWPYPMADAYVASWRALEQLYADGGVRAIGVSNFLIEHIDRLADETEVTPAINQFELHPTFQQSSLAEACRSRSIAVEAYSPLGQGADLTDPAVVSMAEGYGTTPAQVILRWHLQRGHIVIPKASSGDHLRANRDLDGFTLTAQEMNAITAIDTGQRIGSDPKTFALSQIR